MAERYYPPSFRQQEVSDIIGALDQGASVSVIGAPSVGKSNLLKFLDQERLHISDPNSPWKRFAPNALHKGALLAVSIDPNALLPPLPTDRGDIAAMAWPGFELLIHRTTITSELFPTYMPGPHQTTDPELVNRVARLQEQFESAHLGVTDVNDWLHGHLALRHLESLLDAILTSRRYQQNPVRIVYIMDEFERMLNTLPEYFFVALRSLRDRFKYQVAFVTFTRNSLPYLIRDEEQMAVLEPFVELFHDNPVYLGPYNDEDAWSMIQALEGRTMQRSDRAVGLLMRATGGFAGLLRAGFKHADKLQPIPIEDYNTGVTLAATRLAAEENVKEECKTLLRGLSEEEIALLFGITAQRTDLDEATLGELVHKSLIQQAAGGVVRVHPPVLAAHIRNHPTPPPPRPPARPVTIPR
ncbi:MAG: hypothetical protein HY866_08645 [Chloroflexi bacterium]|nr:hypothetical protein [Chloroflexota bacterium]